jgi:glycosyltransferase involved in cell wall biosynthesis
MKQNIIFIYPKLSSFVKLDLQILSFKYNVLQFDFGSQKSWKMILKQIQLFFWLFKNIRKCSVIYIWFADYHGFLPVIFAKIFRKKIIIAVGGYDAAKIKELNYGAHVKPFRSAISKFVLNQSNVLLPSSNSVKEHLFKNVGKHLLSKITICYLGYTPKTTFTNFEKKTKDVICVSASDSINRMKIKGVDRVIELAKITPEVNFTIVGLTGEALKFAQSNSISNLIFFGWLNEVEIQQLLIKTKIIIQLSRYEAFGMVLLEGMNFGCFPIAAINTGAAESISDEIGLTVDPNLLEEIKTHIELILSQELDQKMIQDYAQSMFSFQKRKDIILKLS